MAKDSMASKFLAQFKSRMKMKHITVKQLAKSVKISERQMRRWLAGKCVVRTQRFFLVAALLGLEVRLVEKGVMV